MLYKNHFSGHADQYAASRPVYPDKLAAWLVAESGGNRQAWDAGTGNGQLAHKLADHFDSVVATDASQAQIDHAILHPDVVYRVCQSENSIHDTDSMDLATAAQALHWFHLDPFFEEVKRVVRPGGVFAAIGYPLHQIDEEVDPMVEHFYNEVVGSYWPPERDLVEARYGSINFPFAEELDVPRFRMELEWTRSQLTDYLTSWSATQRYIRKNGNNPVEELEKKLAGFWPEGESRTASWPMFVKAFRIS